MDDLHALEPLVGDWLTLPDVADALGVDVVHVRRLLRDGQLAAARVGERRVLSVPAALVSGDVLIPELAGTLTVLGDAGYSDEEAIRWLFTPDEVLGGTPVDALWGGRKREIRRRAQALAF